MTTNWEKLQSVSVEQPVQPGWKARLESFKQRVSQISWTMALVLMGVGLFAFFSGTVAGVFYATKTLVPRRVQQALAAMPTPTPKPQPTPAPSPTPVPTPTPFKAFTVQAQAANGANLRQEPSLEAEVVIVVPNGTVVYWTGKEVENQGYRWFEVEAKVNGKWVKGWMAHVVLRGPEEGE